MMQEAFPALPGKLADMVRWRTVSSFDPAREDDAEFAGLVGALPALFPNAHGRLDLEQPGDRALLYTWRGSDETLPPAILCAHFDVVPAPDEAEWAHGPFSGDIAGGELWGRGTQDIKICMATILEVAERLLARGFRPRRTILFAFGGDEEAGGMRGARRIAELLAARGVRASFLLDEGGPIGEGMLSFADAPIAFVGVAEKGYCDIMLEARGSGGHASMPPARTATGNLARAVAAVERSPFPARLCATTRSFLSALAPHSRQPYRFFFSRLGLTAPAVLRGLAASPTTNALIRTTSAPTMLSGSPKENVLADRATANLNIRLLPGSGSAEALQRIRRLVEPFGVTARFSHDDAVEEASDESGCDTEGWKAITAALAVSHPEARAVPFLFSAGTDTKHYRDVTEATYRFVPVRQTKEDLARVHARDERVALAELDRCARFYEALILSL